MFVDLKYFTSIITCRLATLIVKHCVHEPWTLLQNLGLIAFLIDFLASFLALENYDKELAFFFFNSLLFSLFVPFAIVFYLIGKTKYPYIAYDHSSAWHFKF